MLFPSVISFDIEFKMCANEFRNICTGFEKSSLVFNFKKENDILFSRRLERVYFIM
jgi:hypothetical protein